MSNISRSLDSRTVLAYIQENAGVKYQVSNLAKVFNTKAEHMRPLVEEIKDQLTSTVIGKCRYYYIPTLAQLADRDKVTLVPISQQKVYKQPANMGERCKELYPEGANFKTMCGNQS